MAMSKRKFSTILAETSQKLNIPRENMIISMGGASLMFGLRQTTNDVDIMMIDSDREIFNRLVSMGHKPKRCEQTGLMSGADIISIGDADLYWYDEVDTNYGVRNYRGYKISTRYQLFVDRLKLGRDKDIADIAMLDSHYNELPQYLKDRYNQLANKTK